MELVRPFERLGRADAGIAGGKGASLGEMTQAGIPVPPGFVILADAFEKFLSEADLVQELDAALDSVKHDDIATVERASETIQALILSAKMPEDMADKITEQFRALNSTYVAVRSSATAEDGASAAWAGQLNTYLNTTEDTLLENVQRCWASLFTPRAIFYRFEKGMHGQKISVAVVVQKMVESETSGIAFSVHPVTEDYNQLIIEAGFGLGEAIVSGQVTPDSYVIEKEPRRIIDTNVSTQSKALYRGISGGVEWKDVPEPRASSQVLADKRILELSELILKIEKHSGFPCDIEWAFEGGKFYITQSRPITTLSAKPVIEEVKLDEWIYWGRWVNGTIFASPWHAALHTQVIKKIQPGLKGDLKILDGRYYFLKSDLDNVRRAIHNRGAAWFHKYFAICDAKTKKFSKFEGSIEEFIPALVDILGCSVLVEFADRIVEEMVRVECEKRKLRFDEIFAQMHPARKTLLMQYQEEMRLLKEKDIDAFVEKWQWVGTHAFAGTPLTRAVVVDALQKHEGNHASVSPKSYWPEVDELIAWGQGLVFQRSNIIEHVDRMIFLQKKALEKIAAQAGITYKELTYLTHDELASLPAGGRLPENLKQRIPVYGYLGVGNSGRVILGKALEEELAKHVQQTASTNELRGTVAFKGLVRGVAAVVHGQDDIAKVREGQILVARETVPDFIMAMKKAAAFVTDQGGITSHAALIAREMKKPCIIGTKVGTQIIKDGDMLEVDAEQGIIRILARATTVILSKIFEREFPLMYFYTWNKSDRDGLQRFTGQTIAHNLFVVPPRGTPGSVWYSLSELDDLEAEALKQVNASPELGARMVERMRAEWQILKPYATGVKKIMNAKELRNYIETLTSYWNTLNTVYYRLPNHADLDADFRKKIDTIRAETQEYSSVMATLPVEAFERLFPEYAHLSYHVWPDELLLFDAGIRPADLARIEERARTGCILLDESILPYERMTEELASRSLALEFVAAEGGDIKGQVAYKGNARGKVRVVRTKEGIRRVEEREIMVSASTDPDYIPAMQKAAAFVTDEGGIMSHAAIIAREMKKPAVIGTRVATQVLKDGDMVEVDAEQGIVRILEKGSMPEYTHHYTASEIGVLYTSHIMDERAFGAVDYVHLIENNETRSYNSVKGLDEADAIGKTIQDKKEYARIIRECERVIKALKKYKAPLLTDKNVIEKWDEYNQLWKDVWHVYRYSDGPFNRTNNAALAEELSPEEIAAGLHNKKSPKKVSKKISYLLDAMQTLGEKRLLLHELAARALSKSGEKVFYKYFEKKYGLSAQDCLMLTIDELHDILQKESVRRDVIEERKKGCVVHKVGNAWVVESGKIFEEWKRRVESSMPQQISGVVAFRGKVQGRAVRHLSWTDVTPLKKGDILVTGMTNPQMIPYLKHAAGIVTDEGGLTCHAAILSREMKIPCIVGTQVATQRIKDRDMIEVDAEKGVVRIIN